MDDLQHDLAHDDFSDRRTLQGIKDEAEMQRTLARRIREKANSAYLVTREEEVADGNRTDIRLSTTNGDQKAVIEVKIADKRWTLTDLERALREQLVGKYLRHANCKAGCLLLTCHGKEKYWIHPETRKQVKFSGIIKFLNDKARTLQSEKMMSVSRYSASTLPIPSPIILILKKEWRKPKISSAAIAIRCTSCPSDGNLSGLKLETCWNCMTAFLRWTAAQQGYVTMAYYNPLWRGHGSYTPTRIIPSHRHGGGIHGWYPSQSSILRW